MGTRADFYVGTDPATMEWLGSIGWDGYPDGVVVALFDVKSEQEWRERVKGFLAARDDGTTPDMGWPWPWEDSRTTDYSYAFDGGAVRIACFGHGWISPEEAKQDDPYPADKQPFPDMSECKNVAMDKRSGLLVIGVK